LSPSQLLLCPRQELVVLIERDAAFRLYGRVDEILGMRRARVEDRRSVQIGELLDVFKERARGSHEFAVAAVNCASGFRRRQCVHAAALQVIDPLRAISGSSSLVVDDFCGRKSFAS
jgi:hypothetical protein